MASTKVVLGIYIPSYGRPDSIAKVVKNLRETTKYKYKLYWGLEKHDTASIQAAKKLKQTVIYNTGDPKYSDALQAIYEATDEPIFLWGNDDFHFLENWDEKPLEMMQDENIGVLGLHDGNPKTGFTAIALVRRKYIEEESGVVDMPNRVLYPYNHNFVDNELTATAQSRGKWAACNAPCIEHQHPSFTWLGDFPTDDTYKKNDSKFIEDAETYNDRIHLWS